MTPQTQRLLSWSLSENLTLMTERWPSSAVELLALQKAHTPELRETQRHRKSLCGGQHTSACGN